MRTRVGFTGGSSKDPTYRRLGDHTETVDIEFNPEVISYETLLGMFWKGHDIYTKHSPQYMSAIYYHDEAQRQLAERTKEKVQKESSRTIVTVIQKATQFYNAEDYHQKYMLRQDRQLLDALKLTDAELIESTLAAKLNGYLAGHGTKEQFEADTAGISVPPESLRYVRKRLKVGQ